MAKKSDLSDLPDLSDLLSTLPLFQDGDEVFHIPVKSIFIFVIFIRKAFFILKLIVIQNCVAVKITFSIDSELSRMEKMKHSITTLHAIYRVSRQPPPPHLPLM